MVEADLRRAARLSLKVKDEIDPQLRIATPEADYWLAVTLGTDERERYEMMAHIKVFMALKQAVAFTWACEVAEPEGLYCAGVAPGDGLAMFMPINGYVKDWTPARFAEPEIFSKVSIDPVLLDLLPGKQQEVTADEMEACSKMFGANGRFPAVHMRSHSIGD